MEDYKLIETDSLHEEILPVLTFPHAPKDETRENLISNFARKKEEALEISPEVKSVQNGGAFFEDYLIGTYGTLDVDVVPKTKKYLERLLNRIVGKKEKGKFQIHILENFQDENAMALPNNCIFITREMLDMCEYEEELLSVLFHEYKHIQKKHAEKNMKRAQKKNDFISAFLQDIGFTRFAEIQANFEPYLKDMDDKGINNQGARYLMFKLFKLSQERKQDSDLAHGAVFDQLLGMEGALGFIHFHHIDGKLKPIPKILKKELKKLPKPREENLHDILDKKEAGTSKMESTDFYQKFKIIESFKASYLYHHVLGKTIEKVVEGHKGVEKLKQERIKRYEWTCQALQLQNDKKILGKILLKVNQYLDTLIGNYMSQDEKIFFRSFLVAASNKKYKDLVAIEEYSYIFDDIIECKSQGLDTCLNILDSKYFEIIDLFLQRDGFEFFESIIFELKDFFYHKNGTFETSRYLKFCGILMEKITVLYEERGILSFHKDKFFTKLVANAFYDLPPKADILQNYLREISELSRQISCVFKEGDLKEWLKANTFSDEVTKHILNIAFEKSEVIGEQKFVALIKSYKEYEKEVQQPMNDFIKERDELLNKRVLDAKKTGDQKEEHEIRDQVEKEIDYVKRVIEINQNEASQFQDLMKKSGEGMLKKTAQEFVCGESLETIGNKLARYIKNLGKKEYKEYEQYNTSYHRDLIVIIAHAYKEMYVPGEHFLKIYDQIEYEIYKSGMSNFIDRVYTNLYEYTHQTFDNFFEHLIFLSDQNRFPSLQAESRSIFQHKVKILISDYFLGYLEKLYETEDEETFFFKIESFLNHFSITFVEVEYDEMDEMIDEFNALVQKILTEKNTKVINTPEGAKRLLMCSYFINDVILQNRMQQVAWKYLFQTLGFDGIFKLLFESFQSQKNLSVEVIGQFLEEKMSTKMQTDKMRQTLLDILSKFEQPDVIKSFGVFVGLEAALDYLMKDKMIFLKFMLQTSKDDTPFRELILKAFLSAPEIVKNSAATNSEILMKRLYQLDEKAKFLLIKELLCGKNGVLMDVKQRKKFVQFFFKTFVQGDERDPILATTRQVFETFVSQPHSDNYIPQIYFAIAPLIKNRLLIPPMKGYKSWQEILIIQDEKYKDLLYKKQKKEKELNDLRKKLDEAYVKKGNYRHEDSPGYQRRIEEDELLSEMYGDDELWSELQTDDIRTDDIRIELESELLKDKISEIEDDVNILNQDIEKLKKEIIDSYDFDGLRFETIDKIYEYITGHLETETDPGLVSAIDFILQVAQHFGIPGVRMLQLLGQYITLTPGQEEAFQKVYDRIKGQNKLSFTQIVEHESPDFWKEFRSIGISEGGGSKSKVYEVENMNGEKEILKGMNPNVEKRMDSIFEILDSLLDALKIQQENMMEEQALKTPQINYELVGYLLEDVKEWIRQDIHFEKYIEKDALFYAHNKNFGKELPGRYEIFVPESRKLPGGIVSEKIKREQKVKGKTLARWNELEADDHDMKQVVSVVTKNYFHQLKPIEGTDGKILVHSNIHPGNIIVTEDDKIGIVDRDFFIEFDQDDANFFQELIDKFRNPFQLFQAVMDYLKKVHPHNEKVFNSVAPMSFFGEIMQIFKNGGDLPQKFMQIMVLLRQNGFKMPLKCSLMIQNIKALNNMAVKAGFTDVAQAYAA